MYSEEDKKFYIAFLEIMCKLHKMINLFGRSVAGIVHIFIKNSYYFWNIYKILYVFSPTSLFISLYPRYSEESHIFKLRLNANRKRI